MFFCYNIKLSYSSVGSQVLADEKLDTWYVKRKQCQDRIEI